MFLYFSLSLPYLTFSINFHSFHCVLVTLAGNRFDPASKKEVTNMNIVKLSEITVFGFKINFKKFKANSHKMMKNDLFRMAQAKS